MYVVSMRRLASLALVALFASLAHGRGARRDVDVAVPPGPPLEWIRAIPCPTPRGGPAVHTGGSLIKPGDGDTVAIRKGDNVKLPTTFGFVRILTWDLTSEVPWTPRKKKDGIATGGDIEPYPPAVNDASYWMTLAVFLRRWLHPGMTSAFEIRLHLMELGEIIRPAMSAAESEPWLKKLVEDMEKQLGPLPKDPPTAPAGATPEETMLLKFAARELSRGYPYDPELRFAPRLYVLGDDGLDLVVKCAKSNHSLLRRNAVAALGQYGLPRVPDEALKLYVDNDNDNVARARCVSILGRRYHRPAVKYFTDRLGAGKNEYFNVSVIYALGQIGDADAVTPIVGYARKFRNDPDVLWVALPALGRLRSDDAVKFLKEIRSDADRNTKSWDEEENNSRPDRPDVAGTKGQVIYQMALLALGMCDRAKNGDAKPEYVSAVLKAARAEAKPDPRIPDSLYTIGNFHPPALMLLMDALPSLGRDGMDFLEDLVRKEDPSADVALRTYGLELLPKDKAIPIAVKWTEGQNDTLRIYGLEFLDRAKAPDAEKIAASTLKRLSTTITRASTAGDKYHAVASARILGERGKGDVAILKTILERCGYLSAKAGETPPEVAAQPLIDALMESAKEGSKDLPKKVDALVDWAVEAKVNTRITKKNRADAEKYVSGLVKNLSAYKDTGNWDTMVRYTRRSVEIYVLGRQLEGDGDLDRFGSQPFEFRPVVPLAGALVMELGRTKDGKALEPLLGMLRDDRHPARAEVCLALGTLGLKEAAVDLVIALDAKDGFVRYCAYRALKAITGEDHFADWLYGDGSAIGPAIAKYQAWVNAHK